MANPTKPAADKPAPAPGIGDTSGVSARAVKLASKCARAAKRYTKAGNAVKAEAARKLGTDLNAIAGRLLTWED